MLSFRELTVQDQAMIREYTKGNRISYFQFTNMYMWRRVMQYRIAEEDGVLYIVDRYRDRAPCAFLPFCTQGREEEALSRLRQAVPDLFALRPLTKESAERVCSYLPSAQMEFRRSQSDYIYRSSDLISLAGRKYHTKKNHLNTFCSSYRWEYHDIGPKSREADLALLLRAAERLYQPGMSQELDEEYAANLDLIGHFSEFSLRGAVLTVDTEPVAYSVGEQIAPDMALIHIEKADREYRGAYAAINQMFVSYAWKDTELINREEDMGIEGLRRAKESYYPMAMQEVYQVRFS